MLNTMNYDIDITKEPPADDTARQYYFIEKAKAYVQRESEELGRPLTFCVTTFGCQMNARDSEKLCLYHFQHLYGKRERQHACLRTSRTVKTKKEEKSAYDDRSLRLYDAGTGGCRKAENKLPLCGYYLRNT